MLVSADTLKAQYQRAVKAYPFLPTVEKRHGLPPFLLFAVASVETNMNNETGDGGHGHGMFQLDDRWHTIPPGFDDDVRKQAATAAGMLKANLAHYAGHLHPAVAAYNAGQGNVDAGIAKHGDPDYWTTHLGAAHVGYGAEVLARRHALVAAFGKPAAKAPHGKADKTPAATVDVTVVVGGKTYRGAIDAA